MNNGKGLKLSNNSGETPCKVCKDRYIGCHGKCLAYIDWKQKHDAIKQEIIDAKEFENLMWKGKQHNALKKLKKRGGKYNGHYGSR